MSTIRDVARRAGVAPITVSRVINNADYVSAETRKRVEQAIAELRYVPNKLAQSLRFNRTNMLALILTDITNPFWTTLARGAEDAASEEDLNIIVCNTDEDPVKQGKYVELLLQRQLDGFLLAPAEDSAQSVTAIQQQNVPLILLDRQIPGIEVDVVRGDSEGGTYDLVQHLIELGHRCIAFLSGPHGISTSTQRAAGYKRALREAGLAVDPVLISYGEYNQDSGYRQTQYVLSADPRPTALVAANNFLAVGAMKALREAGLRVPEDISVAGIDDLSDLLIQPFLTVAAQPAYEMGYTATKLLLDRIADSGDSPPQEIVLPMQLLIRKSAVVHK